MFVVPGAPYVTFARSPSGRSSKVSERRIHPAGIGQKKVTFPLSSKTDALQSAAKALPRQYSHPSYSPILNPRPRRSASFADPLSWPYRPVKSPKPRLFLRDIPTATPTPELKQAANQCFHDYAFLILAPGGVL